MYIFKKKIKFQSIYSSSRQQLSSIVLDCPQLLSAQQLNPGMNSLSSFGIHGMRV